MERKPGEECVDGGRIGKKKPESGERIKRSGKSSAVCTAFIDKSGQRERAWQYYVCSWNYLDVELALVTIGNILLRGDSKASYMAG